MVQVIFAKVSGIDFELEIFELSKDLIIIEVSFGQKDVLLLVDCFIDFYLFLFFLVYVNMNGNISEFGLKLFSSLGFFSKFMFILLISEIHDIEVAFGFAWFCVGITFLSLVPLGSEFFLQLFNVLLFMVLDFLYVKLH